MATIRLDKKGIRQIEKLCKRRVAALQREFAYRANRYLLDFGYHSFLASGPNANNGPGWSYYYAANWNVSVNGIDGGVLTPERDPFDEPAGSYAGDLMAKQMDYGLSVISKAEFGDTIYVTNSDYYGKWLNEGGTEFLTHNTESRPNRFIELCEAFLRDEAKDLVISIRKKEKL